jgi:hypothetical protein
VQHVAGQLTREEDAATVEGRDREQGELDRHHHAEVALAAAQRPEQVRFAVRGDVPQLAVGRHHVQRGHVVGGVAVLAAERPEPATEGVTDHGHRRRRAVEPGQPGLARLLDELAPPHPGLDPRGAVRRVSINKIKSLSHGTREALRAC